MKNILLLSFFSLFLISCGSSKHHGSVTGKSSPNSKVSKRINSQANNRKIIEPTNEIVFEESRDYDDKGSYKIKQEIIDYAKTFEGTRYKFGGTTKSGMDCSGLVSIAFKKENIELPR